MLPLDFTSQLYLTLTYIIITALNLCDVTLSYKHTATVPKYDHRWLKEDFPDPLDLSDTRCSDIIRGQRSYVCDPAGIFSDYESK